MRSDQPNDRQASLFKENDLLRDINTADYFLGLNRKVIFAREATRLSSIHPTVEQNINTNTPVKLQLIAKTDHSLAFIKSASLFFQSSSIVFSISVPDRKTTHNTIQQTKIRIPQQLSFDTAQLQTCSKVVTTHDNRKTTRNTVSASKTVHQRRFG